MPQVFSYTYKSLPTNTHGFFDNKTITRMAYLPIKRICGVVGYLDDPCEGFNYNLCGIDQPFWQPVCVGDKKCTIPDAYKRDYAATTLVIRRLSVSGSRIDEALNSKFTFQIQSSGNSGFIDYNDYNQVKDAIGIVLTFDAQFSETDSILLTNIAKAITDGSAERIRANADVNTGVITLYFHKDEMMKLFGVDICKERIKIVEKPHTEGLLLSYGLSEIECCEDKMQTICDVPSGFIEFKFKATYKGNLANKSTIHLVLGDKGESCTNYNQPGLVYFEQILTGIYNQADLYNALINGNFGNGYYLTPVTGTDDEFIVRMSYAYTRMNYSAVLVINDLCNLEFQVCKQDNINLEITQQPKCCNELTSTGCNSIPGYARYSYTIIEQDWYQFTSTNQYAGIYFHITGITGDSITDTINGKNPFNNIVYLQNIGSNSNFDQYINYLADNWNGFFNDTQCGFLVQNGPTFDIYIKESFLPDCNVPAFVFNIIDDRQCLTIQHEFDFAINTGLNVTDRTDNIFMQSLFGKFQCPYVLKGKQTLPFCCTKAVLPKCCPCSESDLCRIAGDIGKAMTEYLGIQIGLDPFQRPEDYFPGGSVTFILGTLGNIDPDVRTIYPETDCYILSFYKYIISDIETTMQFVCLPKQGCNHTYGGVTNIRIENGKPQIKTIIMKSLTVGIFPLTSVATITRNGTNIQWNLPINFAPAPVDCPADQPCDDSTYCETCTTCRIVKKCIDSDMLYFQFQLPDWWNDWDNNKATHGWVLNPSPGINWFATVEVITPNCEFVDLSYSIAEHFVGYVQSGEFLQQILIDPRYLPEEFYFKFTFNTPKGYMYLYTEPYRKVDCSSRTVIMEGVYPMKGKESRDCDGNSYRMATKYLGTNVFIHSNVVRVPGQLVQSAIEIESEVVNRKINSSVTKDIYIFRTEPIPIYMIKKIKSVFESGKIIINGDYYVFNGKMEKDSTNGTMWSVNAELEKLEPCIRRNFLCI